MPYNMFGVRHRFDELSQARWAERSAFSYPGVASVRAGTM
jgi:hypothetical protein